MEKREDTSELVVVDVKRYKKVKKALAESEERFRQLFENVPIGIYRTTPDGRIVDSNPALVRMLGYGSFAELATRNLEEDFSDAGYERADFVKQLERDGEITGLESVWKKKDGSAIHVRENAKLIRSQDGQVFYEGTVEDITQSKLAEEAERRRTQQLEILNRIISKGNTAASLAELLEVILDCIAAPLAFDTAGIFMYDAESQSVRLLARRGPATDFSLHERYMSVENLPFSHVLLKGQPVFLDDARNSHPFFFEKWGWRIAGSVPLISKGRVVGALNVASCQRQAFSAEEKNILELIGKEAGTLVSKLRTETALRESEKYYRTLIDTSPDVIAVTDLEGNLQTVNQSFIQLSGYSPEEVIGRNGFDFVADQERKEFLAGIQEFIRSGEPLRIEYGFKNRDGVTVPLDLWASLLRDIEGQPKGLIGFARDISERKQAEEALRQSENKYRELVEGHDDVIYSVGADGVIDYISPSIMAIAGFSPEEVIGQSFFDFLPSQDRSSFESQMQHTVEAGSSIGEYAITIKDGTRCWIRASSRGIVENGRVVGVRGIMSDVTQRKEAEIRLLAYQEQLRALSSELTLIEEKERRRIASELHDQIGQNLALCKLKVAALEGDASHEKIRGELSAVRRLLECSIQDARSLIFDLSPPVLYELGFKAALEWLAETIEEQYHVPVEFDDRSGGEALESDRQVILFQVVRELLVNVGKHSRASRAKVILSLEDHLLKIQVNDDGVGFDPAQIYDGRGQSGSFGFFSMRERMQYLGGGLEVKSKPGQGTQVVLTVPRGAPADARAKEKP